MKKIILSVGFSVSLLLCGCSDSNENLVTADAGALQTRAVTGNQVLVQWNNPGQVIDGFGVAQAGWADFLYAHRKRDTVMNLLFGTNGLHLNILRGEVYSHYWKNEGDSTFYMDERVDMPLDDPFFDTDFSADGNEAEEAVAQRRGQRWIIEKARDLYEVDKFIFSTWSPPAYMKSKGSTVKGSLKTDYYQAYAEYLAKFCDAYKTAGIPVYALSPANEPEYEAEWTSCLWWPQYSTLGKFIVNNMAPLFAEQHPEVKIIFGENAQWNKVLYLIMGSKDNVAEIIKKQPAITDYPVIAAGHGYVQPIINTMPKIEPFTAAEEKGIPVWLTEISGPHYSFDASMADGLKWAKLFHQYLVDAHVGAIVWWAGALPDDGTNEGLIHIGKDRVTYQITKRYETFGNFTRYIQPGSQRIAVDTGSSLPSGVLVSSYKKGNRLVVVAINSTAAEVSSELALNGVQPAGDLKRIVTDAGRRWEETDGVAPDADGTYPMVLPANSVVTFVGNVQ